MIEKIAMAVLMAFGFGFSLWLIRRWIMALEVKVDDIVRCHHQCREELPTRFEDRKEASRRVARIHERLDNHERRIAFREGKNGAGA
jgi:hypothetical protein